MKHYFQLLLVAGLIGLPLSATKGSTTPAYPTACMVEDVCELNSEEVLAIQEALAEYLHKQLGEIQAHMSNLTVTDCDDNGGSYGTVTLSYTGQPNVSYSWEIIVTGGGANLVVVLGDL